MVLRRGQFRVERDDAGDGLRFAGIHRTAGRRVAQFQPAGDGRRASGDRTGVRICGAVASDVYGACAGDRL